MIEVNTIEGVRNIIAQWRSKGDRIGFVPTMGNLHEGHLSLVKKAQETTERVVVSIFVNPMQFDKASDLSAYPRTLLNDKQKLKIVGADLVFFPDVASMYADTDTASIITVPVLSDMLEGASRAGHFSGVATIVCKLFNIVTPELAVFGEKDYQQLMLIRKMVNDLNININIIGLPTIRESDGLAMSSRNYYLSKEERKIAPLFYRTLLALIEAFKNDHINVNELENRAIKSLNEHGFKSDYIQLRRQSDLHDNICNNNHLIVLGATWLGKTRLIDNVTFTINKNHC